MSCVPSSLEAQRGPRRVLHCQGALSKDERLPATSVCFTETAFDKNSDSGLLVQDHALSLSKRRLFSGALDLRLGRKMPRGGKVGPIARNLVGEVTL